MLVTFEYQQIRADGHGIVLELSVIAELRSLFDSALMLV